MFHQTYKHMNWIQNKQTFKTFKKCKYYTWILGIDYDVEIINDNAEDDNDKYQIPPIHEKTNFLFRKLKKKSYYQNCPQLTIITHF